MMMSQASAISHPPPSAKPLTAAMIGLVRSNAGETALAHLWALAAMLGGPFEIIAGGKRTLPRSGQDRDPHLPVAGKVVPHLVHLEVTRWMQCVHDLGAV